MVAHKQHPVNFIHLALLAISGFIVFQFFGNAVRGYIDTASLFYWWGFQWFNDASETEHGPLVLIIGLWFFWRNYRAAREKEPFTPSLLQGCALLLVGLTIHLLGYLVQQTRISIGGFLIYVIGVAYAVGGKSCGRAMYFPAFLMLFAIPMEFLSGEIGFHLRLAVIKITYVITDTIGIDILRNGTHLYSADGNYQYDVAPACSGVRSLMALLSLTLIVGYLSFQSLWRRAYIFMMAFPLAFLGNVIRLLCIIVAAEFFGEAAGTWVHEYFGFVVFIVVLGATLIQASLLEKFLPEKKSITNEANTEKSADSTTSTPKYAWAYVGGILIASLVCVLLILKTESASSSNLSGIALAEDKINPVELPQILNFDWMGRPVEVTESERSILPEDTGFSRKIYQDLKGNQVFVSIVLSGKDRSSIHRPELCLIGQGWNIKEKIKHDFSLPNFNEGELETTILKLERETRDGKTIPALFAYWFVSDETTAASHTERMLIGSLQRLFQLKSSRWAYVVVQTISSDGEEQGLQRLQEVMELSVPKFQIAGFEES